jgi:hypothetical protein
MAWAEKPDRTVTIVETISDRKSCILYYTFGKDKRKYLL